ncbi:hypothetical protein H9Q09_00825 [Aurantimonas sp. DM33-3]|uniref:hypothetical protein n=1 Tax=Aurantimonas sp. DM33-3 TaxID=2766955 RepID=UPI0016522A30|nr:hypothetical protein [Aurantimonas sp. DM33-3]MBC6714727.1 hypothetical protein [Aurantimonas sp. DM33-3]
MTPSQIHEAGRLLERRKGYAEVARALRNASRVVGLPNTKVVYDGDERDPITGLGLASDLSLAGIFNRLGFREEDASKRLVDLLAEIAADKLIDVDVELSQLGVEVGSDG